MKKFVIVGGLSRTGTNTTTSFIHLHDRAVSFGTAAGLHPLKEGLDFIRTLLEEKKGLQSPGVMRNNIYFKEYMAEKNERLNNEPIDVDVICLRWDGGEAIFPLILGIVPKGVEPLLIVNLRSLPETFTSQFSNGMLNTEAKEKALIFFKKRMEDSYTYAEHIHSKMSERVLFVDVTGEDALQNYERILAFLELSPNEYQREWMDQLPVTNQTDWTKVTKYQFGDFGELETKRQELLTIGGPKGRAA